MQIPDLIVAIDGFSSTGKSTFAKRIAEQYSLLYLDSGALYRGVTLFALEQGLIAGDGSIDEKGLKAVLPERLDFRTGERKGTFLENAAWSRKSAH